MFRGVVSGNISSQFVELRSNTVMVGGGPTATKAKAKGGQSIETLTVLDIAKASKRFQTREVEGCENRGREQRNRHRH